MRPFTQCPICGGELIVKKVEKLIRGGNHTATVTVEAEVCHHCGERLYDGDTIRKFESIRKKLEQQDVDEFEVIGQTYQVP